MSQTARYRDTARQMRAKAGHASTTEERDHFRELAVAWEGLAAEAEQQERTSSSQSDPKR
jgi:hypothetical protein